MTNAALAQHARESGRGEQATMPRTRTELTRSKSKKANLSANSNQGARGHPGPARRDALASGTRARASALALAARAPSAPNAMSAFMREVGRIEMLDAAGEQRLARTIEERERALWQRLLSFAPGTALVLI